MDNVKRYYDILKRRQFWYIILVNTGSSQCRRTSHSVSIYIVINNRTKQ